MDDRIDEPFEHIPISIIAADRQGRVTYANPTAAQLLQRPLLGHSLTDVLGVSAISEGVSQSRIQGSYYKVFINHTDHGRIWVSLFPMDERSEISSVLDAIPDGLLFVDGTGCVVDCNSNAARLIGCPKSDLMHRHFAQVLQLDEPCAHSLSLTLTTGAACDDLNHEYKRSDHEPIWMSMNARAQVTKEGDITGAVITFKDVTAQLMVESLMRVKDKAIESSINGIAMFHPTGRIIYANRSFLQMIGAAHIGEIMGVQISDFLIPALDLDALQHLGVWQGELRIRKKGGDTISCVLAVSSAFLAWRHESVFMASVSDISDRIKAERERESMITQLMEARDAITARDLLNQAILDAAFDAVLTLDADGKIVQMNASAQALFLCGDKHPPALTDLVVSGPSGFQGSLLKGNTSFDATGVKADGTPFPMRIGIHQISAVDRLVAVIRDLTSEKQLEAQLRHAQKMEAIGLLAGGVAHDFNNILQGIDLALELARSDSRSIDQAASFIARGKDLIRQILRFSRRTPEQQNTPLTLNTVVGEAMKLVQSTMPSTVVLDLQLGETCVVKGDPGDIQRVIINLCTNSIYAMRECGGTLKVRIAQSDLGPTNAFHVAPGHHAIVSVSDSGEGMDEGVLDRVFEPFFTTKPVGEGTGLGLSVIHGIVLNHRGGIAVKSRVGYGTSVEVALPLMTDSQVQSLPSEVSAGGGDERILLVDDEAPIVTMLGAVLEKSGYRIQTTTSSVEAVRWVQADPAGFDLVITDQTMPDMTGDKVAKAIAAVNPKLPVVLMSGFSQKLAQSTPSALGVRRILLKPVSAVQFRKVVRDVLDEKLVCEDQ
ncbi:MAG: PAS domain S-box protein [Acidobacteria bacterium]|nr:PAS domain S-box protein [Acidobacteriota bacterium]